MKMTIMKKGFNYIHSSLKAGSMSHRVTEGCIDMKSVGTERAETGASVMFVRMVKARRAYLTELRVMEFESFGLTLGWLFISGH